MITNLCVDQDRIRSDFTILTDHRLTAQGGVGQDQAINPNADICIDVGRGGVDNRHPGQHPASLIRLRITFSASAR
jgi:hypothetical protein